MKDILEERILVIKVEFTLRQALSIAKKDFHELIIVINIKKRQIAIETLIVRVLDILLI